MDAPSSDHYVTAPLWLPASMVAQSHGVPPRPPACPVGLPAPGLAPAPTNTHAPDFDRSAASLAGETPIVRPRRWLAPPRFIAAAGLSDHDRDPLATSSSPYSSCRVRSSARPDERVPLTARAGGGGRGVFGSGHLRAGRSHPTMAAGGCSSGPPSRGTVLHDGGGGGICSR